MIRIGIRIPRLRVPGLVDSDLKWIDLSLFGDQWQALCFAPTLGLVEATFLDRHVDAFCRSGACLLVVDPQTGAPARQNGFGKRSLPILADPFGRLRRTFGLPRNAPPSRCWTFLIDPAQIVRFHLVHDLNGRDLTALLEVLNHNRHADQQRVLQQC